jgi:cell wall-associated NlpC family hydrolase
MSFTSNTSAVRGRARLLACCAAAVVGAVLVLAPALPASAAPTPAEYEAQINAAWNELEPVIEQYNEMHGQLEATRAKIAGMQKQMAPLQAQVDAALAGVGKYSARLYKTGPGLLALIQAGSPAAFADQITTLDYLARQRRAAVAQAMATLDSFAVARKPLDALQAQLSAQSADLATKRTSIQAQISRLQKLRLAAYGSTMASGGRLRPVSCPMEYFGDPGSRAALKACSLIGKPYVWAAAGPRAYDCSGLTMVAWASVGVRLGHYTGWQWQESRPVSRANLRPGDLVFWFADLHHMGMYVGGGWLVHAPHTGDYVRMARLNIGLPLAGYRRPG